jgi:integrase
VTLPLPATDTATMLAALAARFADFVQRASVRRSAQTIHWYQSGFAIYRTYLEDVPRLTPEILAQRIMDLDGWVDWNLRRGVSEIATNTYWRALRAFFNDWQERDGAPNPYRSHKQPRFQAPLPKALPRDACARILLTAEQYPRWDAFQRARALAVLGVMLYAGLRRGEALALRNRDVNFDTGEIRIERGKGTDGGKERFVPINAPLLRLLRGYIRERQRRGLDETPEFFASTTVGRGMTISTLTVIIRTLVRASGVQFSAHALRHSFVTHLLASGVPLYVARDLAGHSHIETTLIYTRVFPKDRHEHIEKLAF